MIYPTVGRKVHFFSECRTVGPLDGTITKVHDARTVNLSINDENGNQIPNPPTSILLVQEEDEVPSRGRYCCWPPRFEGPKVGGEGRGLAPNQGAK